MYIFRKIILYLVPVLWIIGLELIYKYNDWSYWIGGILSLYLILTIWYLGKRQINRGFFHLLILPLGFALSTFLFGIFIVTPIVFHVTSGVSACILYLLLNQYYLYFYFPYKYQPYSLESLSMYLCIIAAYFVLFSSFGALILINLNIGLVLLAVSIIIGLMTYQFFWIHKVDFSKSWLFIAIILLVLGELLVAVSYLPTSYSVDALILSVCYYLMLGLSKHFIFNTLTKKRLVGYVVIGAIALLSVLLTAQWN